MARKKALFLTGSQKFRLYRWVEQNGRKLIDDKVPRVRVAELAKSALQFEVTESHIWDAEAAVGLPLRQRAAKQQNDIILAGLCDNVAELYIKVRDLTDRLAKLESSPRAANP